MAKHPMIVRAIIELSIPAHARQNQAAAKSPHPNRNATPRNLSPFGITARIF
jgi:hypothetical protein